MLFSGISIFHLYSKEKSTFPMKTLVVFFNSFQVRWPIDSKYLITLHIRHNQVTFQWDIETCFWTKLSVTTFKKSLFTFNLQNFFYWLKQLWLRFFFCCQYHFSSAIFQLIYIKFLSISILDTSQSLH